MLMLTTTHQSYLPIGFNIVIGADSPIVEDKMLGFAGSNHFIKALNDDHVQILRLSEKQEHKM
jgi:hypothetical protein